jgi:hypothetical protein
MKDKLDDKEMTIILSYHDEEFIGDSMPCTLKNEINDTNIVGVLNIISTILHKCCIWFENCGNFEFHPIVS